MIMLIAAGLLGMLFQLLAKVESVKKDFKAANQPFSASKFLQAEWVYIASSVVFILILAILLPDLLSLNVVPENALRLLFTLGGALGSWAFSYFLGKSKKYIRAKVDEKTKTD